MRQVAMGLSIIGISLLLLTGCVPGGYSVDSISKQPEASLTYPGSTEVHTNNFKGRVQFGLDGGDVASTGKSATTTHTQSEVVAYYTEELAAKGWTQRMDNPGAVTAAGLPAHWVSWDKTKLNLSYFVEVWTEGGSTKYFTQLEALR